MFGITISVLKVCLFSLLSMRKDLSWAEVFHRPLFVFTFFDRSWIQEGHNRKVRKREDAYDP